MRSTHESADPSHVPITLEAAAPSAFFHRFGRWCWSFILWCWFFTVLILLFSEGATAATGDAAQGAIVYAKRCEQCHGDSGDADGSAAETMYPRPRIFSENSSYKIRTTGSGELPTDQDLFDIISNGLPGTSMPPFAPVLSEQERHDLVAHIKSLAEDFTDPDYVSTAVTMPELLNLKPVSTSSDSIAAGEFLYQDNQCFKCHGQQGRGDGPSWQELEDDWETPILPANLANLESYRGGSSPQDIYRTISTGLNGTPMPSFADSITPEDRWDLVNYIISLAPPQKDSPDETVIAQRVEQLPALDDDDAWQGVPQVRFQTIPNLIQSPRLYWSSVEFINVQSVYTTEAIALRVQWDDRDQSTGTDAEGSYVDGDGAIYLDTEHPDQFAIQFPAKRNDKLRPYFMLGDKKRAVNLWWWRSDTAEMKEINGKGFGKFNEQGADSQQIQSAIHWEDGRYTLTTHRALQTEDVGRDFQFEPNLFIPIAFHVWDGSHGEVGQRHSMTIWYWLYLQPEVPSTIYSYPPMTFLVTLGLLGLIIRTTRRQVAGAREDKPPGAAIPPTGSTPEPDAIQPVATPTDAAEPAEATPANAATTPDAAEPTDETGRADAHPTPDSHAPTDTSIRQTDTSNVHINRKSYVVIFVLLALLTALEVGVVLVPGISRTLMISALVLMALVKAGMVGLFYMHLSHETSWLRSSVIIPLMLPFFYAIVLILEAVWRLG